MAGGAAATAATSAVPTSAAAVLEGAAAGVPEAALGIKQTPTQVDKLPRSWRIEGVVLTKKRPAGDPEYFLATFE